MVAARMAGHAKTRRPSETMPEVSRHAVVEPTAELAGDVRVGPFCYVGPEVVIGAGSILESHVTVVGRTTLGAGTRVFPLAVIGTEAPGGDGDPTCIIGEANTIREHVTICAGTAPPTRIGNHNLIMIASHIGAGTTIGDHGIFDNCSQIGARAVIEDYVRTSGFAAVRPGVRVGAYSFVLGYSVVQEDAPPYAMLQGFPVRVRGVNARNLEACGFGQSDIHALKAVFRELFDGGNSQANPKVLKRIGEEDRNPCVRRLIEAVRDGAAHAEAEHG